MLSMHNLKTIENASEQFLEGREIRLELGDTISPIDENFNNYDATEGLNKNIRLLLFRRWSQVIDWSINLGNNHFALTISNTNIKCGNRWENDPIHIRISRDIYQNMLFDIKKNFPTITWIFIIPELTKNEIIHFHAIIAIKNFIDYNYCLYNSLSLLLPTILNYHILREYSEWPNLDIKISPLKYFNDIRNWIMYMHKDISKWPYGGCLNVVNYYKDDIQRELSLYFNILIRPLKDKKGNEYDIKNEDPFFKPFSVDIGILDYEKLDWNIKDGNERFKNYLSKLTQVDKFDGIKLTNNKINNDTLIKLIKYYIIFNEFYIYNNNIYIKIINSEISYIYVDDLKNHIYNNFLDNVKKYYIENFNNYFNGFNFDDLCDTFLLKTKQIVDSLEILSTNKIIPNFSIIEFTDGLYFIKYDRFLPKKFIHNIIHKKNITTLKYFKQTYEWVRKNKPTTWIEAIKNALNIKNDLNYFENSDYNNIIFFFFKILNEIFDKKNTLYIFGNSGTGKSLLIGSILYKIFGKQQIGSVINDGNFQFQDLEGKIIAILEEWKFNQNNSAEFLKITSGEELLIAKKYSKEHIIIKKLFSVVLTNHEIIIKNKNLNEAFNNRIYYCEFKNKILDFNLKNFDDFTKKLYSEEANIIIYCNKYFFKKNKGILNKKISCERFIELLNNNYSNNKIKLNKLLKNNKNN